MVHASFAPAGLEKHRDAAFVFGPKRMPDGHTAEELHPCPGERGHLVILGQSKTSAAGDYIHAHALKQGDASKIRFTAHFPHSGLYKLWCQFDLNGRIHTADFWVRVE